MSYDIVEYLKELEMKEAELKEEIEVDENELDNKKEIAWEKKKLEKSDAK